MEASAILEIKTPILGETRSSFKSGDTSHPDILHECLHASQNLMLKDQFTYATFLVGRLGHTLDEVEQNWHP